MSDESVLVEFDRVRDNRVRAVSYSRTMSCGWETADTEKWGAIWRYKNNLDMLNDEYWFDEDGDVRVFVAPAEMSGWNAHCYKFQDLPTDDPAADSDEGNDGEIYSYINSVTYKLIGSAVQPTPVAEWVEYPIPCVDENPTFLLFLPAGTTAPAPSPVSAPAQ